MDTGKNKSNENPIIINVLVIGRSEKVIFFLKIVKRASPATANKTKAFPKIACIPVSPISLMLPVLISNIPKTHNIIPSNAFGAILSFKNKKEKIANIAGVVLVMIPPSVAVVYFNPYRIKIRNRNIPVRDCRNKNNKSLLLISILNTLPSIRQAIGSIAIMAIIKVTICDMKTGNIFVIIFPTTTELPASVMAIDN